MWVAGTTRKPSVEWEENLFGIIIDGYIDYFTQVSFDKNSIVKFHKTVPQIYPNSIWPVSINGTLEFCNITDSHP